MPASALQSKSSNLTDIVRVWDMYSPDYNCPLLKERVGEPAIIALFSPKTLNPKKSHAERACLEHVLPEL